MENMPGQAMQLGETTFAGPATSVAELVEKIGWNYGVLWTQNWSDTASSPWTELQVLEHYSNVRTIGGRGWDGSELLESNCLSTSFRGFTDGRTWAQETLWRGERCTFRKVLFPAADASNVEGSIETLVFIPNYNALGGRVLELGSTQVVSEESLPLVFKEGEEFLRLYTDFVDSLISESAVDDLGSPGSVGNSCNSILETPSSTYTLSASHECGNGMQQNHQSQLRRTESFSSNPILVMQLQDLQEGPQKMKQTEKTCLDQGDQPGASHEKHPESPASVGTIHHRGPPTSQPSTKARPTHHAQAERKRRENHKHLMEALRKILPCKKKDKASVLELAVKTIKQSTVENEALRRELGKMEERLRLSDRLRNDPSINFSGKYESGNDFSSRGSFSHH